jgi:WD40 repeat protein
MKRKNPGLSLLGRRKKHSSAQRSRALSIERLERRELLAILGMYVSLEGSDSISYLSADGSKLEHVVKTGAYPTDVAIDRSKNRILWNEQLGAVYAAPLAGGEKSVFAGNVNGLAITHDAVTRTTIFGNGGGIDFSTDDGNRRGTLVSGVTPTGLVVDPANARFFYTAVGGIVGTANLDGSGHHVIYRKPGSSLEAIDYDPITRSLFFVDQNHGTLDTLLDDGNNHRVLHDGLVNPKGVAVDPWNQMLYVPEVTSGTIYKSRTDGTDWQVFQTGLPRPEGIALDIIRPPQNTITVHSPAELAVSKIIEATKPTEPGKAESNPVFVSVRLEPDDETIGVSIQQFPERECPAGKFCTGISYDENPVYTDGAEAGDYGDASIAISIAADVLSSVIAGASGGGPINPFGDANSPKTLLTTSADQVLYGGLKGDTFHLNNEGGIALGGKGGDTFKIEAPITTTFGNKGPDRFEIDSKFARTFGGLGSDEYHLKANARDVQIGDASQSGTIHTPHVDWSNVNLQANGNDLKITTSDGRTATFIDFNSIPRDGWSIVTENATYSIENAVRLNVRDAAKAAVGVYLDNSSVAKFQVAELENAVPLNDPQTGLRATAFDRTGFPGTTGSLETSGGKLPAGHKVVSVAGTEAVDWKDYVADVQLGGPQIRSLSTRLQELATASPISHLTITGESLGGMVGVGAARDFAIAHPNTDVTVYAFNTLGVPRGLADTFKVPNLHIVYVEYEFDFLHQLGNHDYISPYGITFPETVYPIGANVINIPGTPGDNVPWNILYNHSSERIVDFLNSITPESKSKTPELRRISSPAVVEDSNAPSATIPKDALIAISEYVAEIERSLQPPVIPIFELRVDIGSSELLASGWKSLDASDYYSSEAVIGWKAGTKVEIEDQIINDDLRRDLAVGKSLPLQMNLPTGFFDITVFSGDKAYRQGMAVFANGDYLGDLSSIPGEVRESTFRVRHGGGLFDLELRDLGGSTSNAVLNGLIVKQVAPWQPVPSSSATPVDPSLIFITPDYAEPITWLDRVEAIVKPVGEIVKTIAIIVAAPYLSPLLIAQSAYSLAKSGHQLTEALQFKTPEIDPWVFQAQVGLNLLNAKRGLSLFRTTASAVSLTDVESASNERIEKLFPSDVVIIDAQQQLNDGIKPFGLLDDGVIDEAAHRKSMKRLEDQLVRVAKVKTRELLDKSESGKVDLHFIGHGVAASASRTTVDRLANEAIATSIDHVGLELLAPIAVKGVSDYYLYNPWSRPFSLTVNNWFENRSDVPSEFIKGKPLDGHLGGGIRGQLNGINRLFSKQDPNGEFMLRNLTKNGELVDGKVVAETLSNDGRFAAIGTDTGFLSIFALTNGKRLYDQQIFLKNGFSSLQFSASGDRLAMLNSEGRVVVMDVTTFEHVLSTKIDNAVAIQWSSDDSSVIAGRKGGELVSVKAELTSAGAQTIIAATQKDLQNFWIGQDRIVTIHNFRNVVVWKRSVSGLIQQSQYQAPRDITAIDVHLVSSTIVMAQGMNVTVSDFANGFNQRLQLNDHATAVQSVAISKDGSTFATGGEDEVIRTYDLRKAMGQQRSLQELYKSPMLFVRNLVLSNDGSTLLAGFVDKAGGGVKDRDISDEVDDQLPFWNDFIGEQKAHQVAPYVWIEEFLPESTFFALKDSAAHDAIFGAANDGWRLALPTSALERIGGHDQPLIDDTIDDEETIPLSFTSGLPNLTIFNPHEFLLTGLVNNSARRSLSWSAKSSDVSKVQVALSDAKVTLQPIDEGFATIVLSVSDGNSTIRTAFRVTADGSYWRGVADQLAADTRAAMRQLDSADDLIDQADAKLTRANQKATDATDEAERVSRRLSDVQAELQSTQNRANRTQADYEAALQTRDRVHADYNKAEATRVTAKMNYDRLDTATRQAHETYILLNNQRQAAWQRYQNATKLNQIQRQVEWQQKRDEANAAETQWRNLQSQRSAAEQVLNTARKQRDEIEQRLAQANRLLDSALASRNSTRQTLTEVQGRWNQLQRDLTTVRGQLSAAQADVISARTQLSQASANWRSSADGLSAVAQRLTEARQIKWVPRIGLDTLENGLLKDAQRKQIRIETQLSDLDLRVNRVQNRIKVATEMLPR